MTDNHKSCEDKDCPACNSHTLAKVFDNWMFGIIECEAKYKDDNE